MALNPAYAEQTTRARPFCLGYVYAQGEKVNSIVGFDGTTVEQYILGSGEWDRCLYLSVQPTDVYTANWGVGTVGQYGSGGPGHVSIHDGRLVYYHFHGGSYSPRGVPLNLISLGPDQGSDTWLQYFPSVTPALCFSGIAYYFVRRTITTTPMNPLGIYASTRCRIFDSNGNVAGYGFTTNPTWQMIETILRFQLKCQQPWIAGLTAAEKACFDWPAMVAHAGRNATILASGRPRFTGNFAFAADSTLAAMMETQLRNCRSFKRERGSVISFVGDDARTPVFTFSRRALVPDTLKLEKKDLSTAPNVYVPQFRDLEIPAVTQVASVACSQQTTSGNTSTIQTFTTVGAQPFFSWDRFTYSGSADDADFAGDYQVAFYETTVNGVTAQSAPPIANQFNASSVLATPGSTAATTGGFVGTQQSRFKQRAPTGVQHRSHQRSLGQVALGITPLPRQRPVQYDLGNNTFDQTNRLMKFMRDRDLGPDGQHWISPLKGTLSGFASAVDRDGNALAAVEEGDVIALDETAAIEFAGQFEVLEIESTSTTRDEGGDQVTLTLQSYFETAATDVSDPPGNSYQTLPNSLLPMADALAANPFWVMQATVTGTVASGGSITVSLPDLSVWWLGDPLPTAYAGVQITGLAANTQVILYLNVTTKAVTPTLTSDTRNAHPPVPMPAGQIVMFMGKLTSTAGTGGGGTGVGVRPGGGPIGGPIPGPPGSS